MLNLPEKEPVMDAYLTNNLEQSDELAYDVADLFKLFACIVLMVAEFFFISVPVQRFLHGTCGRRRSARSTSSGCRK